MLKMIFLCRRRRDLTREEYARRVLEGHVPLALRHHPTLRRYVVNLTERDPEGGPEIDSLPALYFDNLEDFQERLYDSPEGQEIVHRDVEGFMEGADAFATSETLHKNEASPVALGARSPGVKWICALRRHPALSQMEFREGWLERHVPRVLEHHPRLTRFATNVVEARLSETGEAWDGFAEMHFATEQDAGEYLFDSPEGKRILEESSEALVDVCRVYAVGEYVER